MLAETNIIQTIVREIHADLETPTSVYLKLRGQGPSFLLESVEGGERIARYSFYRRLAAGRNTSCAATRSRSSKAMFSASSQ